jgi:hypothetical protein
MNNWTIVSYLNTAGNPILAPRCLGSAAIRSRVSAGVRKAGRKPEPSSAGPRVPPCGQGKDDMYHCESATLTRKIQIRHHPSDAKGNTLRYAIFKAYVVRLTMHFSQNG